MQPSKYDPTLTSLFQNSLGPVKPPKRSPSEAKFPIKGNGGIVSNGISKKQARNGVDSATKAPGDDFDYSDEAHTLLTESTLLNAQNVDSNAIETNRKRKRNRSDDNDDLEGRYLDALAREDSREVKPIESRHRDKRRDRGEPLVVSMSAEHTSDDGSEDESIERSASESVQEPVNVLQHESVTVMKDERNLEKSTRTVFLANVSTSAIKSKSAKRILLDHLTSFTLTGKKDTKVEIESLRFRSVAFTSNAAPKKASFARKELMDATTRSTNAYVVYTSQGAAREASVSLNGTMVLDRHLRVDSVAHPAKIDHRRCVFVGNLGFVDDDTNIKAAGDTGKETKARKPKEPADVEEGLWRQFEKAGTVESVRVVRDKTTRVGKGFAYVQFRDANTVEKALLFNEKKFPPMLPRLLRVTRSKNLSKASGGEKSAKPARNQESGTGYRPKASSQSRSFSGRASKLLGRAGAAQIRAREGKRGPTSERNDVTKIEKPMVFEGYRANRLQGKGALKLGKASKKQGKPVNRSSRRGADFKAKGRKKARTGSR